MIRINLLPLAERKQRRGIKLPSLSGGSRLIWMGASVAIFLGMIGAMAALQSRQVHELDNAVAEATEEARRLEPQLQRIRRLTKEREEVNRRLSIIASLDRDRYFRVQLLDDISRQMPANCWLTSVKEQGANSVAIEGITFSNYIVADLMNNLQKSDHVNGVMLNVAEEGHVDDHKVIQFSLSTNVSPR